MGTLVSTLFAFGSHDEVFSFRVWQSIVQYFHDISQEPHMPLDLLLAYFPQDSLMSSCECIIMSFSCFIELCSSSLDIAYSAIQLEIVSCLAMQIHLLYPSQLVSLLPGGDFPQSVDILHMYPCIKHRYVPLLGTSLFSLMTLVSSQFVTIKLVYSFFKLFK